MKKYFAIALISISFMLCSCLDTTRPDDVDQRNESKLSESEKQGESKGKNSIVPSDNDTTNQNVTNDFLNELQEDIIGGDYTHDERINMSLEYIENLMNFLEIEANSKSSNDELEEILNYNIVSKTKVFNGNKYRIIRYDGLPELFGTLERKWTVIQWWSEEETYVQMLHAQSADNIDDIIIVDEDNEIIMLAGGYLTSYRPFPIFLSTWKLVENQWVAVNLFDNDISLGEEFTLFENKIILNSNTQQKIKLNHEGDEFLISEEDSGKNQYQFIIREGEVILK